MNHGIRLVACLGMLAVFLGSASCSIYPAYIDTKHRLDRFAGVLRPHAPPTVWEQPIAETDLDLLVPLGADRVLVGLLDVDPSMWNTLGPLHGPLCAVATATGTRLWCFTREEDRRVRWSAAASGDTVLLVASSKESTRVIAVAASDGHKIFETQLAATAQVAQRADTTDFIALEPGRLAAYDAAGQPRWSADGQFTGNTLVMWGDLALVLGTQISAFSLASGKRTWTAATVGAASSACPTVLAENYAIAGGANGQIVRFDRHGTIAWSHSLEAPVQGLASNGNIVVGAIGDTKGGRLIGLSLDRGERRWELALDGPLMSALAASDNTIALTVGTSLLLVDARSGRAVTHAPLPVSEARAPDVVEFRPGRVIVSAETAAAALRLSDGASLWSYQIRGAQPHSLGAIMHDSAVVVNDSMRIFDPDGGEILPALPKADTAGRVGMDAQSPIFQELRFGMAKIGSKIARNSNIMVNLSLATTGRSLDTMTQTQAAMAVGSAIGSVFVQAFFNAAVESVRERRRFAFAAALEAHSWSVQDDYIVRPIRLKLGEALFVVRLADGAWAEVPIAPFESTVARDLMMETDLNLVAQGHFLVTKGVSLNPAAWRSDTRFRSMATVNRTLLGFDLGSVEFHPATEYATRSLARPPRS